VKVVVVVLAIAIVALWIRLNTAIDVMYDMEAKIKLLARATRELHNVGCRQ